MPKNKKKITLFAAIAAAAMITAVVLASCGSSSSSSPSPASEPEPKSVWAVESITLKTSGTTITYTYDEAGHATSYKSETEDPIIRTTTYEQFDEKGTPLFYTSTTSAQNGETQYTAKQECEYNGDKLISVNATRAEGATDAITYAYEGNAVVSSTQITKAADSALEVVGSYNENGYVAEHTMALDLNIGASVRSSATITYDMDPQGNVAGFTITRSTKPIDSEETTTSTKKYTCVCDENGNVTEVHETTGLLIGQLTYREIENPLPYTRMQSQMRNFALNF